MHKKNNSVRENLVLHSPPNVQPAYISKNKTPIRVSPIHSPLNNLHLRSNRSKVSSPISFTHNHPLLSQSPPKEAFYLLRGFSSVPYVHPRNEITGGDLSNEKEDNEDKNKKKITKVVVKKNNSKAPSSPQELLSMFFQREEDHKGLRQISESVIKKAALLNFNEDKTSPLTKDMVSFVPSEDLSPNNVRNNLLNSFADNSPIYSQEERDKLDGAANIGAKLKQNYQHFYIKTTDISTKDKKVVAKHSSVDVQKGDKDKKKLSTKGNISIIAKVFWRNKDTSAHILNSAMTTTKSTRSPTNISQSNFGDEFKTRKSHKGPVEDRSQLVFVSTKNRPKTSGFKRNELERKDSENSPDYWFSGSKDSTIIQLFDSPKNMMVSSIVSQVETPKERPKTNYDGARPKIKSISFKDMNNLKHSAKKSARNRKEAEEQNFNFTNHSHKKSTNFTTNPSPNKVRIELTSTLEEETPPINSSWLMHSKLMIDKKELSIVTDKDEDKQKDITQKSVYKSSPQGMARMERLPAEAQVLHKEIEKLQMRLFTTSIIKKSRNPAPVDEEVYDALKSSKQRLNALDIKIIQEEYAKKAKEDMHPDYGRIDKIIMGLKFFSTLNKSIRLKLLRCATYKAYNAGDIIFEQGEVGDLMYIILRGAVKVKVTRKSQYGTLETNTVGVLYDGSYFGENTSISDPSRPIESPFKPKTSNHHLDAINLETGLDWRLDPTSPKVVVRREEADPARMEEILERLKRGEETPRNRKEERRTATIQVSESCDLLCISKREYDLICQSLIQKDVDNKLLALHCLPLLAELDRLTLLPIATNLVQKSYKYGEIILAAGEKVDRLRIIVSGKCKLVLGNIRKADFKSPIREKNFIDPNGRFSIGLTDYSCKETSIRDNDESVLIKKVQKDLETWKNSNRSFNYDKLGYVDGELLYLEHIVLSVISKGEFFGGRSLFKKEDFTANDSEEIKRLYLQEPSRVSVVADTADVEVFELTKESFEFVPLFLGVKKILKFGLRSVREFDDFDIQKELAQIVEWTNFKDKEAKDFDKMKESHRSQSQKSPKT